MKYGMQNELFMPRDPAEPPIQSSITFAEAPLLSNHLVEIGSIGRDISMLKIDGILWAFRSTAAATFSTLCFQEVENSASWPPEVPRTGLFGYKNGR